MKRDGRAHGAVLLCGCVVERHFDRTMKMRKISALQSCSGSTKLWRMSGLPQDYFETNE